MKVRLASASEQVVATLAPLALERAHCLGSTTSARNCLPTAAGCAAQGSSYQLHIICLVLFKTVLTCVPATVGSRFYSLGMEKLSQRLVPWQPVPVCFQNSASSPRGPVRDSKIMARLFQGIASEGGPLVICIIITWGKQTSLKSNLNFSPFPRS